MKQKKWWVGLLSALCAVTSVVIPDSATSIDDDAFGKCSSLTSVYYKGTAEDWAKVEVDSTIKLNQHAYVYYYSETQPTTTGNYWHYVDGVPTVW